MRKYQFYDFRKLIRGEKFDVIFPGWEGSRERVAFFSPHDDDAILGAGYLMIACLDTGATVHLYIFCDGRAGYSTIEEKDGIIVRRKAETKLAYKEMGLDPDNITWFDFPDFSLTSRIGWVLPGGEEGAFKRTIKSLRKFGATRLVVPNHYREHIDHEAAAKIGCYDAPQVGDPIVADWGTGAPIKTVLQYAVWGDFSPEDAMIHNAAPIRANRALVADEDIEKVIEAGLRRYESQAAIIDNLVQRRKQRIRNKKAAELYIDIDPRPVLDYVPYWRVINRIK